ncbi:OmpA family protein [Sphingopyxis sp. MSC1_008]|jgi:outer membrane protein OmpA-like peptidoglycan-associated protein|uniref:OmpA family protein n=1 Tax=Sphingopyxis sp. MSC1_008 TaxID=2909265 RepID=UPI0020BF454D|nr:OmpA family protein [Sphingopyxis sp. MSC1_008]
MMRFASLSIGAALLAACSPGGGEDAPAGDAATGAGGTSGPGAAAADTPPAAAGRPGNATAGSTMTGTVSDLKGDVSGLNIRVTDTTTIVDLPADALFEFDKADLTPGAEAELRKASELIRKAPPGAIEVIGHSDAKGDDAYNLRLSEKRARTVADWFASQIGVRQRAFRVSGKGETTPIAPNQTAEGKDDAAGRARNRRVEVVLPR